MTAQTYISKSNPSAPPMPRRWFWQKKAQECKEERDHYLQQLAAAQGEAVFKTLLLINISACEEFTYQTRDQAAESFKLSMAMAGLGFVLVAASVIVGVYAQMMVPNALDIAYLTGIAGIVSEFIAGVFFYLYNRTIQQINTFHAQLQAAQKIVVGLVLNSMVADETQRNASSLEMIKLLLAQPALQGLSEKN
jgi:hypothetical protein